MNTIYICVGSTGEYSDHVEWFVRAFADEEKCKKFVEAVSAAYRDLCPHGKDYYWGKDKTNPLDPNMRTDYTGTNYNMFSVPFEE